MKRNISILLVVIAVGAAGFGLGRMTHPGFEFRVEVSQSGTNLSSKDGCSWARASYASMENTYAFEVNENGVRSLGAIPD